MYNCKVYVPVIYTHSWENTDANRSIMNFLRNTWIFQGGQVTKGITNGASTSSRDSIRSSHSFSNWAPLALLSSKQVQDNVTLFSLYYWAQTTIIFLSSLYNEIHRLLGLKIASICHYTCYKAPKLWYNWIQSSLNPRREVIKHDEWKFGRWATK
jgi:hypothetical protein